MLDYLNLAVDPKQVERVTERIGKERCVERDAEVEQYMSLPLTQRKDKPEGVAAPSLAVVGVDGGRLQIRTIRTASTSAENSAGAEEALPPDEQHRGTHWREDKHPTEDRSQLPGRPGTRRAAQSQIQFSLVFLTRW